MTPRKVGSTYPANRSKHGLSKTPEFRAWINMKSRCYTPSSDCFHRYGGRGIKVCDRWINSFPAFLEDMGTRPTSKHSIDRINLDGDYCAENCRWATMKEQARNTSQNTIVVLNGQEMILEDAIALARVNRRTVYERLAAGKDISEAIR